MKFPEANLHLLTNFHERRLLSLFELPKVTGNVPDCSSVRFTMWRPNTWISLEPGKILNTLVVPLRLEAIACPQRSENPMDACTTFTSVVGSTITMRIGNAWVNPIDLLWFRLSLMKL
jgi:hypothetical protein